MIAHCQKELAPLKEFILPGEGKVSGFLHQSRTVCRWAERVYVRLSREAPVDAVKTRGEPEFLWQRNVRKAAG